MSGSHGPGTGPPPGPWRPLGGLIAELEGAGSLRSVIGGPGRPDEVPVASRRLFGVAWDSRRVEPGELFVALPGRRHDGHDFAAQAVARGAAAAIVERPLAGLGVPQLLVAAARPALAFAAAWWFDHPSRELGIVGVTGTDGKTTTAYLVRSVLGAAGQPAGLLGTVEVIVGGRSLGNPERTTTPEAPILQGHLAAMLEAGERWAVVESSSHGLALERVGAVAYDVAVLTNLSHEHLEFHGSFEAYEAAKRRLFERLAVGPANPDKGWGKSAVVNLDERHAPKFLAAAREAGARVVTYGFEPSSEVRATGLEQDLHHLRLELSTPRWQRSVTLGLAGRFNAHNALAAAAVGEALALEPEAIRAGLEALAGVPGRMERIDLGQPFGAIVDYAHTPEALAKVLDDLAPLAGASGGGLIVVFGSAGERDVLKRPLMGRVAAERCRLVVLTDEDPRGEDRMAILEAIAAGAEAAGATVGHELRLEPDRPAAIALALEEARPGDVVVFAGKGHEKTIEWAEGDLPWDEAEEVRGGLHALGWDRHP
ncbi:MAG: UDP-N-acetylmuramoyl-L-alanyl-D-glutamate--2,6-diaminopimelate ligase [Candidatus Limnocylindrales bacterium]